MGTPRQKIQLLIVAASIVFVAGGDDCVCALISKPSCEGRDFDMMDTNTKNERTLDMRVHGLVNHVAGRYV